MLTQMYPICCSFMTCYCAPTSIFSIKRIIVSFGAAADSATSSANAASPISLMTGCPSRISALLRFRKLTNRKAPVRLKLMRYPTEMMGRRGCSAAFDKSSHPRQYVQNLHVLNVPQATKAPGASASVLKSNCFCKGEGYVFAEILWQSPHPSKTV